MFPQMTIALAGATGGSARWPVTGLEIALAVALFAAGLLIDRRIAQRRRAAAGTRVRAIAQQGPPTSVTLHDTRTWPAPTMLIGPPASSAFPAVEEVQR